MGSHAASSFIMIVTKHPTNYAKLWPFLSQAIEPVYYVLLYKLLFFFQEIPWTSNVTARGSIAIWLHRKYNDRWLWFVNICHLPDPLLHGNCDDGGSITFIDKGVFVGVQKTVAHVKMSQHKIMQHDQQPLHVDVVPVPMRAGPSANE